MVCIKYYAAIQIKWIGNQWEDAHAIKGVKHEKSQMKTLNLWTFVKIVVISNSNNVIIQVECAKLVKM